MAENTENQEGTESTADEVVDNTSVVPEGGGSELTYSDVEKQAMAQGWVPEDQYEGTGKWRTAEDFLDRGEFFSKMDEQKRQIKSLDAALTETKRHIARVRANEYNRALAALRTEKKQAINDGDGDRVVEIDEQINNTRVAASQEIAAISQPPQMPASQAPVFMIWENRNPWYNQDRAMKIYADTVAEELVQRGITNPTELLAETERRTKKEFAHKFNNPNRSKPGVVESSGNKGTGSREKFELSAEETQVMNKFVKHGVMTREEYIADIKAERNRKG
jgi:hypothetical protein